MDALSDEQIATNETTFLDLIKSIKIEGADIDGLCNYLTSSDFFTAPASTKFHNSRRGGLCEHSLNVYNSLITLVDQFASHDEITQIQDTNAITGEPMTMPDGSPMMKEEHTRVRNFSDDTLKIVGLLHDISKTNFYESYIQAKKVYSESGSKYDNMGNFDWVSEEQYKVKEPTDRMLAGSKGTNSFLIISKYIPLAEEEIIAIINQYAGMDKTENTEDLGPILNRYNLTVLLHVADVLSSYVIEKI
jgi:hypothetical protein